MKVVSELQINTKHIHPAAAEFDKWVALALQHCQQKLPVLIRLTDEEESAYLNETYRQRSGPTNILSFPDEAIPGFEQSELGQLVICVPLVIKEAQTQNIPLEHHWAHLVIHGTLHLLGYDHIEETEALTMEALETQLLAKLAIPSPYT